MSATKAAKPPNSDMLVSVASILGDDPVVAERFIEDALAVLSAHFNYYELLLIDNGSPAEVYFKVQALQSTMANVRLVRLSRRYSREVALAAALDHSIGDYVVLIDSLSHPVHLIPQMVERCLRGCDSLVAIPAESELGFIDRFAIRKIYKLASRVLGYRLKPDESYYRLFSRRLVNSIVRIRSKNRYLSCLNASIGLAQDTITYEPSDLERKALRRGGLLRQLIAVSDILVSNSAAPLRFASLLAVLASLGNMIYLIYIFIVTLVKSRLAEGWLTTSLTQTTMFLLLFLVLAIVSEYIARILHETKDQPLYFVEFESNSSVSSTGSDRLNVIHQAAPPEEADAVARV